MPDERGPGEPRWEGGGARDPPVASAAVAPAAAAAAAARARAFRALCFVVKSLAAAESPAQVLAAGHVETPDLFTSHREAAVPPPAPFAFPASSLSPQDRRDSGSLFSSVGLFPPGFQERLRVPLLFFLEKIRIQALLGGLGEGWDPVRKAP